MLFIRNICFCLIIIKWFVESLFFFRQLVFLIDKTGQVQSKQSKSKAQLHNQKARGPKAKRGDDGEAEETITSRKYKPAATELWKPPSPGIKTLTTSVFTTP
ncbi:hypothetical protein HID58_062420 [Brassica napus]|uniref:Secreted protein n=1 Tax=Brassica napus TaxID=3708 RepID=A0ABQ8A1D2_BRANA|nr:hypothetical protein HID58_062420 [Brassica napus]